MSKTSIIDTERTSEILEDAWMGLGDIDSSQLCNPLKTVPDFLFNEPHLYIIWLLQNPEYFSLFVKEIFGIKLLPFQCLILKEFWYRRFPILIGSRGLGKCVNGNTLIFTDSGIKKIGDVVGWDAQEKTRIYDIPTVLNEDKHFNVVEYGWNNGYSETIKIQTNQGFELEGTPEHPIRVVRNKQILWVELRDVKLNDYIPIDRSEIWFENTVEIDKDLAYLFGLMVGDGGYTIRGKFTFTSGDQSQHDIVKELWKRFFNKEYKQLKNRPITGQVNSTEVWDEWFSKWGFNSPECALKAFPTCILKAQKEAVASFIRGLMDTDGTATKKFLGIEYCSKSEELVKTLQFILTKFGIISRVKKRLNKKYQRYYYYLYMFGNQAKLFGQKIGFGLKRKQDILESHFNKELNTNLDIVPRELIEEYFTTNKLLKSISTAQNISYNKLRKLIVSSELDPIIEHNYYYDNVSKIESSYCQTFDVHCKTNHSFITNGIISHNSSIIAIYALLRMIFIPGRKVVITGAGFRQSKIIFEYMERIWNNSPLLRDLVGNDGRNGPSHGTDMWKFTIGESYCIAIPIGNGEKIRGQRAHDIVIDEFAVCNADIFEHVISGFAAVSADPFGNIQRIAKQRMAEKLGIELPQSFNEQHTANSIILSGTAYYEFNHFYKYWKKYRDIIYSKGDPDKLAELGIDPELDWRDYSIIRIPYEKIPSGFMEEAIVSRAKNSMNISLYTMEFSACVVANTKIITDCGVKEIKDIKIGDRVLTHKGRFKPVEKLMSRFYDGEILRINAYGYNQIISITPEHPVFKNGDFTAVENVSDCFELSNLQELNGVTEIYSRDYTQNYKERNGYLFPASGPSIYNNDQVNFIVESKLSRKDLAKMFGCTKGQISSIRSTYKRKKPKNAIPSVIKLDYNFGIIIGYYAAEGSGGSNGKAIHFSLDGHKDTKLDVFVEQLIKAIKESLGLTPKQYYSTDNVVNIVICSRVFFDIIKWICPGIANNKFIRPEILFSNEEFMRGVLVGYWNGDGHRSDTRVPVASSSISESLSTQIRVILSYFKISSSLNMRPLSESEFRGKTYISKYNPFEVRLNGDNARKFNNQFYNRDEILTEDGHHCVINNNITSNFRVNKIVREKYCGLVYNFEVEDDHSYSLQNMTVHNCFSSDSNGFFKRSLLEKCVDEHTIKLFGEDKRQYVIGIDPASEQDNFCITVVEVSTNIRRIVYCWTSTKNTYKEALKSGKAKENDFYDYVCRKILDLVNHFNVIGIAIDSQGGGHAVASRLHNPSILNKDAGEVPLWPFIDLEKPQECDVEFGRHIIELINFADSQWTNDANHNMRLEFETRQLLFPKFDGLTFAEADLSSIDGIKKCDITEEAILEIEEMKNELSSIVMTQTPSGRDRWDTPDIKLPGSKKGRLRKDRYSSLLMSAYLGRRLAQKKVDVDYSTQFGGVAQTIKEENREEVKFIGKDAKAMSLAKQLNDLYS